MTTCRLSAFRSLVSHQFSLAVVAASVVAFATTAHGATFCFQTSLAAPSLVCESAVSAATGSGTFVLDDVANTLDYNISFSGLTSAEIAAHIHGAASTSTCAAIIFPFPLGSPKIGTWSGMSPAEVSFVKTQMTYVNIHSVNFGGGEIRGQIVPCPTPTSTAPTPTPTPTATPGGVDHFNCYKAGATKGSVKFLGIPNPPGVTLQDQFGTSTIEVKKPKFLCAPTNKLGEDPTAPAHPEHLKGYPVKNASKPPFPTNLLVVDQFNPSGLRVDAKKQSHLLVPSMKSLVSTPPTPPAFVTDHFECYKVVVTRGTPKFVALAGVTLQDQFGSMTVIVKKPKYLCNPVNKNGGDPTAPSHVPHLMCYQVKQTDLTPFAKITGIFVNNQFGPETLDVKKPSELCVPALKTP